MAEKIRILFMSASPSNTGRIRTDAEASAIARKLKQGPAGGSFEFIQCHAMRVSDLQLYLMEYKPHIVHFSGHASRSRKILLEDNAGNSKAIEPDTLTSVFKLHKKNIQIVLLNACYTLEQAEAINQTIDFTLGISKMIKDRAAITFAGAFYRALAFEMTVQEAFESGRLELSAWKFRNPDIIHLLVRDGVDPSREILKPARAVGASKADAWNHMLTRVASGLSTETEVGTIRRALLDESLMLDQTGEMSRRRGRSIKAVRVAGDAGSFHVEVDATTYRRIQEALYPPPPLLSPPPPGLIFVGRDAQLARFRQALRAKATAAGDVNLTIIRGWPGVGKTTLVGVLGRDPRILKTFPHGVLWTSLERRPEVMGKLADWGHALGVEDFLRIHTPEEATARLAAILRRRRMLLIVDDVWDAAHALPFVQAAVGSKCAVLVTTRLPGVAAALTLHKERIHFLPVLDEKDALTLLRHIIPDIVVSHAVECLQLVRDLECLPLALHVAGRLLKEEAGIGFSVTDLIEAISKKNRLLSEPAPLDRAEGGTIPTVQALLKKSTDVLDPLSRDCFAFLGVFAPKPATFDLDAIKDVWEIARPEPVIKNLVRYGLLEPVGPGRFQIHDLLVQHARTIIV